jgi:hypothetical protein
MTPTYRPPLTRLACALNTHADTVATIAIALIVLACLATALVCHPALYLR